MPPAETGQKQRVRRNPSEKRHPGAPGGPDLGADPAVWVTADRFHPVSGPTGAVPPGPSPVVDPDTAYRLVASAVREAVASLGPIEGGIRDTAQTFRWADSRDANRKFVAVVESLRLLASVADMAATATGLDLADLCGPNGAAGFLDEMGHALDQLTAQQFAEDWIAVAATLEESLAPSLGGWRQVFTTILLQADFRFRGRRVH
jgi:hypothetical protein